VRAAVRHFARVRHRRGAVCLHAGGDPSVGAHRLRHSVATDLLAHGAGLVEIGQVLRHQDQTTTSVYAKVDRAALAALALPWPGSDR